MDIKYAIRMLWNDFCTVYEYQDKTDDNKSTYQVPVPVLENERCKLSFSQLQPVNQSETAKIVQTVKLFIDNRIDIKAGSKITVNQHSSGRILEYKQSGAAGLFENHQEIPLVPYEEYA